MTCPIGYQQRGNVCVANLDNSDTVTPTPTECAPGEIGFHSVHVDQTRGMYHERTENVTPHCRPNDGRSLPEVVRGRTDLCRPNYAVSIWEGGGDDEIRCLDRNFSARRLAMPHVPTNPISPRPYGVAYDVSSETAPASTTSSATNLFTLELGARPPVLGVNFSTPRRDLITPLSDSSQFRFGLTYRRFDPDGVNFSASLAAVYGSVQGFEPPTGSLGESSESNGVGGMASATIGFPIFGNQRGGLVGILGLNVSAYALTFQRDFVGGSNHDTGFADVNPILGFDFIFNDVHFGPFSNIVGRMTGGYMWGQRLGDSGISYRGPTLMDMSVGVGW